jgi:hypothetical protein
MGREAAAILTQTRRPRPEIHGVSAKRHRSMARPAVMTGFSLWESGSPLRTFPSPAHGTLLRTEVQVRLAAAVRCSLGGSPSNPAGAEKVSGDFLRGRGTLQPASTIGTRASMPNQHMPDRKNSTPRGRRRTLGVAQIDHELRRQDRPRAARPSTAEGAAALAGRHQLGFQLVGPAGQVLHGQSKQLFARRFRPAEQALGHLNPAD